MYTIHLHVKWATLYFCQVLMKHEFSRQIYQKSSNIKFHENSSSRSRVVPCGPTDRRQEHMTKLTAAYCDFANWLKN